MRKKEMPEFNDHRNCQGLSDLLRERAVAQQLGRERRYRKGAYIWRPDDAADRIYLLQEGQVVELREGAKAQDIITRIVMSGEPFGDLCFCMPKESIRHTSARAVSDVVALEVRFAEFVQALQQDEQGLTTMLFQFCSRLTEAERRLQILTYRGADERLGRLLLDLGQSRGVASEHSPDTVTVPVTHDHLAQLAAMNRSHVTVTMGGFRKAGLVHYRRDAPLSIDLARLKKYLDSLT